MPGLMPVRSYYTCISMSVFSVSRAVASPLRARSDADQQLVRNSWILHRSGSGKNGPLFRSQRLRGVLVCPAVAYEAEAAETLNDEAEDFYAILGVAPDASPQDIKKAYHRIMRACHPDVVGLEEFEDDEGSAEEVCVFVNDIYETLMDKEKREAYDAIAGFSGTAVNPFHNTDYERNQVFVSEYDCIGCKNCTNVCPHTFMIEDEYGRARAMQQGVDTDELLQEAIDTCPVNCIHWVTSPQLALLETTMAKMERVDAWILMMGGGNGVDVFMEAATAWEKRQARIRARREGTGHTWMPWGGQAAATANTYSGYSSGASAATGGRAQEAAAATAASARKWRDFQRSRQRSAVGHLPQGKK